jgi:hypothetical protein
MASPRARWDSDFLVHVRALTTDDTEHVWPMNRCRDEVLNRSTAALNHLQITRLLAFHLSNTLSAPAENGFLIVQELNGSRDVRWAIHCLSEVVMERTWLRFLLQSAIAKLWNKSDVVLKAYRSLQSAERAESEKSVELRHVLCSRVSEIFDVQALVGSWPEWEDAPIWAERLGRDVQERIEFYSDLDLVLRDNNEDVTAAEGQCAAEEFLSPPHAGEE